MKLRTTFGKLAMVFALFGAADAAAQERVIVNVDNVKIGQAPAFDSPGAPVARGAVLTVLERNGDWIRVFDGSNMGFIHSAFIVGAGGAAPATAAAPQVAPQAFPPQSAPAAYPPQYVGAPTPGAVRAPGTPGYKDPTMAQIYSAVIIGGGQFYSGDTGKGLMLAGLGYGSFLVGPWIVASMVANDVEDCWADDWSSDCYDTAESAPALVYGLWAVGLGSWVYGIMSADDSAKRANATPYYALTPIIDQKGDRTYAGLQFRF